MKILIVVFAILFTSKVFTQNQKITITISCKQTNEPIENCTIKNTSTKQTYLTNNRGRTQLIINKNATIEVSAIGYSTLRQIVTSDTSVLLQPSISTLQDIVVTANREQSKRSETPVAIATISSALITQTKATTIDQLLNKVSGVYMINLSNEQHTMSIRQPMSSRANFLYLEDGIPIRTTGIFNHNALLEINMAAVANIEVVKGPASSYYGSEAIGGAVNFITQAPQTKPMAKLSYQKNNLGYNRIDVQTSYTKNKWGVALSGYHATTRNSFIEYSDYKKTTFTARVDYKISNKSTLVNSLTYLDYYTDMGGGTDSINYANKTFTSPNTFTYRKVYATRYRSTYEHVWNSNSKTKVNLVYRKNSVRQNPMYLIADSYYPVPGGGFVGQKDLSHGQVNNATFHTYALIAQHKQNFVWKKAVLIAGLTVDASPSTFIANYIKIKKDTLPTSPSYNKYVSFVNRPDSMLTNYRNNITNYAAFANVELSPIANMRVVGSLRYDAFTYNFNNNLSIAAFTGVPDTLVTFKRLSPKIGATYSINNKGGVYSNYSIGFVPPQAAELFGGVKVPNLKAAVYHNYEIGGWALLMQGKLTTDISIYNLQGTNEIIAVRNIDGSFSNLNAGQTAHKGIELGVNSAVTNEVTARLSTSYNSHKFVQYVEYGENSSGNDMATAPRCITNAELWYKPAFAKGLRIGVEWQHIGKYYMDNANKYTDNGYNNINVRTTYQYKAAEVWVHVLNTLNSYYAYTVTSSSYGRSYIPGLPLNVNVGVTYNFCKLLAK